MPHLYTYIDRIFYLLATLYSYTRLVRILHPFAPFLLYSLVFHISYYASFLMYFLSAFLYKILYLIFSLLDITLLSFFYIPFLSLVFPIIRTRLFVDFFLHNFLSILFLGLCVHLDACSLVYVICLLCFRLFHHKLYSISTMKPLKYGTFYIHSLYLHSFYTSLLHIFLY